MSVKAARVGVLAVLAAGVLLVGRADAGSHILALSPENVEAGRIGSLNAYLSGQGGEGAIWLKMPNGEVLKGRFKVNVGGSVGALGRAYGIDRPGGAYTTSGWKMEHPTPAVIDMRGAGGATVHCEVMNNGAVQASGSGVCSFSNGAVYRVLY
jgi:hypothetical protein